MGKTYRYNEDFGQEFEAKSKDKSLEKFKNKSQKDHDKGSSKRKGSLRGNFDKQRVWPVPNEKKKGQKI